MFKCSVRLSPRCKPGRTDRTGGVPPDDNTAAAADVTLAVAAELLAVGTGRLLMGGGGGGVTLDGSVREATTGAELSCVIGNATGAAVRRDAEAEPDESTVGGGPLVVENLLARTNETTQQ
jgi:hypothetical protein